MSDPEGQTPGNARCPTLRVRHRPRTRSRIRRSPGRSKAQIACRARTGPGQVRRLRPQDHRQEPLLLPRRSANQAHAHRRSARAAKRISKASRSSAAPDSCSTACWPPSVTVKKACTSPTSSTGARREIARRRRRRPRPAGHSSSGRSNSSRPMSSCCSAARRPNRCWDWPRASCGCAAAGMRQISGATPAGLIATLHPAYLLAHSCGQAPRVARPAGHQGGAEFLRLGPFVEPDTKSVEIPIEFSRNSADQVKRRYKASR